MGTGTGTGTGTRGFVAMLPWVFVLGAAVVLWQVDLGGEEVWVSGVEVVESVPGEQRFEVAPGLVYRGAEQRTVRLVRGGLVEVAHYFEVTGAVAQVSVPTVLVGDRRERLEVDLPPISGGEGQLLRVEQRYSLPASWRGERAKLEVAGQGVMSFEVEPGRPSGGPQALYRVVRASEAPVIDGRDDDPAWRNAPWGPSFVAAEGGASARGGSRARLLWDADYLYVFAELADRDLFSPYFRRDDTLWKADCVELFIDADRNRRGYIELQVNPRNAVFDAWFPTTRAGRAEFGFDAGMRSAVALRGTADPGDRDRGWSVELAIPHRAVIGDAPYATSVRLPPAPGDRWRMNLVRVDVGSLGGRQVATSWNRISVRDYHGLNRMFTVEFAAPDAKEK